MSRIQLRATAYVVLAIMVGLVIAGAAGAAKYPERFDAKQIIVTRDGERGLRVTEVVDIDFGSFDRRGYQRTLRNDVGRPVDITADSPTITPDITVDEFERSTRIRVGRASETHTGQHRVVLTYTLPNVISGTMLDYSLIDPGSDNETGRFAVELHGFRLDNSVCSVGVFAVTGGCALEDTAFGQTVVLEPLNGGFGLNISGAVTPVDTTIAPVINDIVPHRSGIGQWWRPVVVLVVGAAVIELIVRSFRRRGENIVGVGGAAAAAHWSPGEETTRISDDDLLALATTEFVPPADISPWEGRALLDEAVDQDSPEHWLSSMVGVGAISVVDDSGTVVITRHDDAIATLTTEDQELLESLVPGDEPRRITGTYDKDIKAIWNSIVRSQRTRIDARSWWRGRIARSGFNPGLAPFVAIIVMLVYVIVAGLIFGDDDGSYLVESFAIHTVGTALVVGIVALAAAYHQRASRTAAGSAAFLQTESFRRFLEASEARHVEDAHSRGVLREYSAWAVALGEAKAWSRAAEKVGLAAVTSTVAATTMVHDNVRIFESAVVPPSSSSSGSGSSFGGGGGGVGGGGGGGSSGSW